MAVVHSFHPTPVTSAPFEPLDIHPQITAKALLRASDKDKKALVDIHELLHRLFVRNRNQHRRNHWFKSLHQFRKQLGLLLNEMDSSKKASIASKLEQRLQVWDNRYIHQWYLHFTQLVACGPFAVIGLVLMACTARVCRVVGITDLYEEIGSDDMKIVLRSLDEGIAVYEFGELIAKNGVDDDDDDDDDYDDSEDEGILIERH